MPDSNCSFVPSKRGADKLFHEGYLYTCRYKASDGSKRWICDREDCAGTCKTRLEGLQVVAEAGAAHYHLPEPERAQAAQVRGKARAEAKSQAAATAQQVAASALEGVAAEAMPTVPSNTHLKRAAWRARYAEQKKRARVDGNQ
eukprot:8300585-Karenia_brevis.AAC.1